MGGGALSLACTRLQSVVRWSKDDQPLVICLLELSRCCPFSGSCRIVYPEQRNSTGLLVLSIKGASQEYRVLDVALDQSEGRLGGHPSGHIRYSGPVRRQRVSPRPSQYRRPPSTSAGVQPFASGPPPHRKAPDNEPYRKRCLSRKADFAGSAQFLPSTESTRKAAIAVAAAAW